MKRVWLAIVLALICYTAVDILIWQRIFEEGSRQTTILRDQIPYYHSAWQIVLAGLVVVGSIGLWKEKLKMVFFALATVTLAFSGIEDLLYYWLDGKSVPQQLPWLNQAALIIKFGAVTDTQLLVSALIWLIFWLTMTALVLWSEG